MPPSADPAPSENRLPCADPAQIVDVIFKPLARHNDARVSSVLASVEAVEWLAFALAELKYPLPSGLGDGVEAILR